MTTEYNLTNYSIKELSLIMFNTQSLYSGMMSILNSHTEYRPVGITTHSLLKNFVDNKGYKYTVEQWEFFKNDVVTHYDEMITKVLIEQLKQTQEI